MESLTWFVNSRQASDEAAITTSIATVTNGTASVDYAGSIHKRHERMHQGSTTLVDLTSGQLE